MAIEVKAFYVKDSKRFHRYEIEDPQGMITGSIYVSKEVGEVPKQITVSLSVKDAGRKED